MFSSSKNKRKIFPLPNVDHRRQSDHKTNLEPNSMTHNQRAHKLRRGLSTEKEHELKQTKEGAASLSSWHQISDSSMRRPRQRCYAHYREVLYATRATVKFRLTPPEEPEPKQRLDINNHRSPIWKQKKAIPCPDINAKEIQPTTTAPYWWIGNTSRSGSGELVPAPTCHHLQLKSDRPTIFENSKVIYLMRFSLLF